MELPLKSSEACSDTISCGFFIKGYLLYGESEFISQHRPCYSRTGGGGSMFTIRDILCVNEGRSAQGLETVSDWGPAVMTVDNR